MRIDHLNFNVSNLNNSVEFYTKLFNFEEKERGKSSSGTDYAIIGHPERFYMCLYQNTANVEQRGFNHFGVNVDRFDEMVQKLIANNIEIQYGGEVNWPKSRSAYILGPDNEEIEITERFGGDLN